MASEQDDAVFDQELDDDDESSQSQDDDDDIENDDVLVENDDVLADEEDEEDLNSVSPSTSSPAAVPLAVPSSSLVTIALPNGSGVSKHTATVTYTTTVTSSTAPDPKRQRLSNETTTTTATNATTATLLVNQEEKKPAQFDESRRLFQRLWTDEDEIELLQGFLDYTTQRGSNHPDTALFYDQIKSKLQLDFNKNQLVEKLRRLKKKYRNVLNKITSGKDFSFKSPHDQATFEISRKIWSSTGKLAVEDGNLDDDDGNPNLNPNFMDGEVKIEDQKPTPKSGKRSRRRSSFGGVGSGKVDDKRAVNDGFVAANNDVNNNSNNNNNNSNSNVNVSSVVEETVRSCLSPLFKELLSNAMAAGMSCSGRGIGGLAMSAMPLSFGGGEVMVDEKWRKQHILELEVYSKRLELVQDQIRAQLEELRSIGE